MKGSSEDHATDALGSVLQRKCTMQQKEGSKKKKNVLAKVESVSLLILPAALHAAALSGERAPSKFLLALAREKICVGVIHPQGDHSWHPPWAAPCSRCPPC